jgi:dihydrofolate reductase
MEGTLFLAATTSMGIGYRGRIPWKQDIPSENAYFHRVSGNAPHGTMNAVIVGRKSWDAMTRKPMAGRINIIVTRSSAKIKHELKRMHIGVQDHVHVTSSLDEAYQLLSMVYDKTGSVNIDSWPQNQDIGGPLPQLGRIFLTGGDFAGAILDDTRTRRFLLTTIHQDYVCDAFLPLTFDKDGAAGWRRCSEHVHEQWIGEAVPNGLVHETGTSFTSMMFERG